MENKNSRINNKIIAFSTIKGKKNFELIKFFLENIDSSSLNMTNEGFVSINNKSDFFDILKDVLSESLLKKASFLWFPENNKLKWRSIVKIAKKLVSHYSLSFSYEKYPFLYRNIAVFSFGVYFDSRNLRLHLFPKLPPSMFFNYNAHPPLHFLDKEKKNKFSSICYEFTDYIASSVNVSSKISLEKNSLWLVSFYDPRYSSLRGEQKLHHFDKLVDYDIKLYRSLFFRFLNPRELTIIGVNFSGAFVLNLNENKCFVEYAILYKDNDSSISAINLILRE